ncbi:MAG: DUF177 domain-containing protein [Hyphomicrobium sp.]|jgi:uncharacterized protein
MIEILDWSYRVSEVPEAGLRVTREATDAERARVAEDLEIEACRRLLCEFSIRAIGKGHYRLAGKVTADVTQACIVTLEPVEQTAEGAFSVEFWPTGAIPGTPEEEQEALSAAEIEPIEHGRIDAGRIIFETLATALDPYPRKPGAELGEEHAQPAGSAGLSPFAALKKLRE